MELQTTKWANTTNSSRILFKHHVFVNARKNFYFKILFMWICVCYDILSSATVRQYSQSAIHNCDCIVWFHFQMHVQWNDIQFHLCEYSTDLPKLSYTNNSFQSSLWWKKIWHAYEHLRTNLWSGNLPLYVWLGRAVPTALVFVGSADEWGFFFSSNDSKSKSFVIKFQWFFFVFSFLFNHIFSISVCVYVNVVSKSDMCMMYDHFWMAFCFQTKCLCSNALLKCYFVSVVNVLWIFFCCC